MTYTIERQREIVTISSERLLQLRAPVLSTLSLPPKPLSRCEREPPHVGLAARRSAPTREIALRSFAVSVSR